MSFIQLQLRRDSAADWTANDPVLAEGELGLELDTDQVKMGDGVTPWTGLPYFANVIGPQGPQGPAGADGATGPQGPQGIAGPQGPAGADSTVPGPQGDTGPQGPIGATGPQGDTGPQGPQGPQGDTGADSTVPGPQGDAGPQGDGFTGGSYNPLTGEVVFTSDDGLGFSTSDLRGADGATGPQGPQGDVGPQGPAGADGATGPQGPQGDPGADSTVPGPPGDDGAQGPAGPQGPQGDTGPAGATGPQGPQGDPGADGADGATGPAGADGATGPQGPQGDTGPAGADGSDGAAGPQGPAGADGADGAQGPPGPTAVSEDADNAAVLGSDNLIYVPTSGDGGGVTEDEVGAIAAGSTLGLEQALLANAGQPGLTVLAVGFTNTGKAQGVSLGDGNVVEVYANGDDFNAGTVLYREFMSLGEPICFTGLSNGAIITASQGFYGFSEQLDGNAESPMPLLSYGLSFKSTFFYAFRDSSGGSNDRGFVRIVNGPLKSLVSLTRGDGTPVNADGGTGAPQTDIEVAPWGFLTLQTDLNTEFIINSTNPVMACIHAEMRTVDPRFHDSRLIMPLTNDGITWPRSGNVSAPYDNTLVNYYVRDGATGSFVVSPGAFVDFDGATGATDSDYEPDGATRVRAVGLISAYSGADSAGLEASPLMPTSAMSQVVAQPLFISDTGDGGNSGVAISSPYVGTAKIYSWNTVTSSLDLAYTVPLNRGASVTVSDQNDQNIPAAGLVANEVVEGTVELVGQLDAGVVIADVPITVVVQNADSGLTPTIRSQNGTTTTSIVNDDDETLSLGITPDNLKAEIVLGSDDLLYRREVTGGTATWVVA